MIAPLALLLLQAAAPEAQALEDRCWTKRKSGQYNLMQYKGDRACVDLDPPRLFEGVWIDEFEGSKFAENVRNIVAAKQAKPSIWLSIGEPLKDFDLPYDGRGRAYRVRFIGRAGTDLNRKMSVGYGHRGGSDGLIVVDEMLSMTDLGRVDGRRHVR